MTENHHKSSKSHETSGKTKRLGSGIPGLDELIGGGYIEQDTYLITGGTGTGKTMFCAQFLLDGLKNDENGIFFSLEERPSDVLKDAAEFGMDFSEYIDKKKFQIIYQDPFEMVDFTSLVKSKIKNMGAKRVVIDSTSIFGMVFKDEHELRNRLYELIKSLKDIEGCVTLLTAEILEDSKTLSRFGVEEFVVDGVIVLNYLGIGETNNRSLQIRKMRRTNHGKDFYELKFGKNGLSVEKERALG